MDDADFPDSVITGFVFQNRVICQGPSHRHMRPHGGSDWSE